MTAAIPTDENSGPRLPDLRLADLKFSLEHGDSAGREECYGELMKAIRNDKMAPFYRYLSDNCQIFSERFDQDLYHSMVKSNDEALKEYSEKIKDAEENLGETEIADALLAKFEFLAKIVDKDAALTAYKETFEKIPTLGAKIDLVIAVIRLGLFFADDSLITRSFERAKGLIDQGGDWDRRNRLRVYEGYYFLTQRKFEQASNLFLETLSTFTNTELMSYQKFISYVILSSILTLGRPGMKSKVMEAPEVLEVIHEMPTLEKFMESLYQGEYEKFFSALATIEQILKTDRALFLHYRYYVREMRIRAYAQLLESYRSVTIDSMAQQFGVTTEFLDADLAKFIAAGRLHCVIDKEGKVVETNRPDSKNSQYQLCIKHGDLLLNRIQRLSRVINM